MGDPVVREVRLQWNFTPRKGKPMVGVETIQTTSEIWDSVFVILV